MEINHYDIEIWRWQKNGQAKLYTENKELIDQLKRQKNAKPSAYYYKNGILIAQDFIFNSSPEKLFKKYKNKKENYSINFNKRCDPVFPLHFSVESEVAA